MIGQLILAAALAGTATAAPRYLVVFHNLNSFTDPADQDMAVEAYKGFEAVARRNGVTIQPYFTGLSFEMYLRKAPELMEELRNSGRDWNHHGANRPPRPIPMDRVRGKTWADAVRAIEDYEQYALDAVSGQLDPSQPGGLKRMTAWFGKPALCTGRYGNAPILAVTKDPYGVRMAVGTNDVFRLPSSWFWYMGTLNRPSDVFVHPNFDFIDWARVEFAKQQGQDPSTVKRNRPNEPWNVYEKVAPRFDKLDPDIPAFLVIGFHNNDLFGGGNLTEMGQTGARMEAGFRKFFLQKMDEFLRWVTREKGFQPTTLRQVYSMARANYVTPAPADAGTMAAQIVQSVEQGKTLPLSVNSSRSGHSLVEAWQLLWATLAGVKPEFGDVLGPTALEEEGAVPVRASAAQVRTAARSLKPAKALPSHVEVAGQTINAARFLYLMAKIVGGAAEAEAPPLGMLPPVEPRDQRSRDSLSRLQMWTYKPAYFDKLGGRPQRAVSDGI
jgi:hypothetical protein